MNIEQVRDYALSLPGVTEGMPFGEDCLVFRIEDKIFLCLNLDSNPPRLALKLAPERGEELRETYAAITPAWHWNKRHWNDIYYEQGFTDTQIQAWIEEAYRLVLSALPKSLQKKYS